MEKNFIVGKIEKRLKKDNSGFYYVLNCYAKNNKGDLTCITRPDGKNKPYYINDDKLTILTEIYGLEVVDLTK